MPELEYYVASLGACPRCARCSTTQRFPYSRMVPGCNGSSVLLYVPWGSAELKHPLGICRLARSVAEDPVVALVATGRTTEIKWSTLEDKEWFCILLTNGRL